MWNPKRRPAQSPPSISPTGRRSDQSHPSTSICPTPQANSPPPAPYYPPVPSADLQANEELAQTRPAFQEYSLLYQTVSRQRDLSDRDEAVKRDPSRRRASSDGPIPPRAMECAKQLASVAACDLDLVYVNALARLIQQSGLVEKRLMSGAEVDYDVVVIGAGVSQ